MAVQPEVKHVNQKLTPFFNASARQAKFRSFDFSSLSVQKLDFWADFVASGFDGEGEGEPDWSLSI